MSEAKGGAVPMSQPTFGFQFERLEQGWRWMAYDRLGRVADQGIAPTKAAAAARVIDTLART